MLLDRRNQRMLMNPTIKGSKVKFFDLAESTIAEDVCLRQRLIFSMGLNFMVSAFPVFSI